MPSAAFRRLQRASSTDDVLAVIAELQTRPKRSKYGAVKTQAFGMTFDSKREAMRYVLLRQWEREGRIANLKCQPKFSLSVNGTVIGHYIGDFRYIKNGQDAVEDSKGFRTPLFKWKAKHFEAEYPLIKLVLT